MKPRSMQHRRRIDGLVRIVASISAMFGLVILAWILGVVITRGADALNWSFFTERPTPAGVPGGGLANAILGTLMITGLAALIGVPLGLLAGVFLSEFGKASKLAPAIRFAANILMGTPSILIGIFVYALMVMPMGRFSGYAGSVALAIIMLPIVTRTTEDMLHLFPTRCANPRWRWARRAGE